MRHIYPFLFTFAMALFVAGQIQAQTYCTSLYSTGCTVGDDINSFIFGSFQKLNTPCPAGGYANYTTDTIVVHQGLTYDVSINSNYPCCQYFAIWIDLNSDGDFDDPGEFLWASQVANNFSLEWINGEVTIPLSAPLGPKRLRVRGKYAAPAMTAGQSCTSFTWGEAHDYTVVILPAPPCFPPSLTGVTDITNNTADINFVSGPDALGTSLQYGPAGFSLGNGTIVTATSSPHTISGLTQNTSYHVYIQDDCPDNEVSGWMGPLSFTTLPDNMIQVTYSGGDIPSSYQSPALTTDISVCADTLTVNVPPGFWITSVDVAYDVTSTGGAFMSEQRTRLMLPALGLGENQYYQGVGGGGTFSYNRTGLEMFFGLSGSLDFVLDVKRVFCLAPENECSNTCVYVNNNSWTLSVILDTMPACAEPYYLTLQNITDVSANISWVPLTPTVAFNYRYGLTGTPLASMSNNVTVQEFIELTGLTAETTYDFYVQAICGLGENSEWAGPFTFTTLCNFLPPGTYTLGDSLADFLDFNDLIDYLECGGLGGPVIINVLPGSGPFNEHVKFGNIAGSSATNTLTINGNGNVLEFLPTINDQRATLLLDGSSYLTFDSLHIKSLGTGTLGIGVQLMNNANHITFNNCVMEVSTEATGTGHAPFVTSNSLTAATTIGLAASNLTVTNCELIGGYYGMVINGPTSGPWSQNNYIANNVIRDFYIYGLFVRGQENSVFDRNEITRGTRSNISTFYGLYLTNGMAGTMFTNNSIHNPRGNFVGTSTVGTYPIYVTGASGTETNPFYMINNLVYNINVGGVQYGAYFLGFNTNDHFRLYHNSISLADNNPGSSSTIRGMWISSNPTNAEVKNNIFHVSHNGSGTKHAVYYTTPGGIEIDHNVVSMASTSGSNSVGFAGVNYTTFEDWQDAGYDENGSGANPLFLSEALFLYPQAGAISGIGANLTAIAPLDYDGVERPINPSPGAYEFEIDSCMAPFVYSVTVGDTFAHITWIENVPTPLWNIEYGPAGFTLGTGTTATSTSPSFVLSDLDPETSYDFYASPDCGADSQWGDPVTFSTLCLFLPGGTYTLGDSLADFLNFTELVDYFACSGIAGPVVIDVIPGSGPFEEQISFPFIAGSSEINTITILGNGNTLQFLATNTSERHTLRLDGTGYMSFHNMTIKSLGTTTTQFGFAVHLMNNAHHITFDSCVVEVASDLTSLNYAAFVTSNSATSATIIGLAASNLTVTNSTIIGGYYGMVINGPTAGPWSENNYIANNEIRDFYLYGLYVRGQENSVFDRNDISRANRTVISTFYGLYSTSGLEGTMFTNNTIHNPQGLAGPSTAGVYPIYFTGAFGTEANPYYMINNKVFNINMNGLTYAAYFLGVSNHYRFYHNTISLAHTTGTGTIAAYFQSNIAVDVKVKNNIFHVEHGGTGTKYCMYISSSAADVDSDHNVLSMASTEGTNNIGFYGGAISTFAAWQALGLDSNSVPNDPFFVNPISNLMPQSSGIAGIGADFTAVAPVDFYGVVRDTTPDPGAIEFEPAGCLAPSSLTFSEITYNSAELSWVDNTPEGVMWLIEIGPAGFTPTGVPTDTAFSQPYLITGLSEVTSYSVYVQVVCEDDETSAWAGPATFTTFPEFAVVVTYDSGQIPTIYESPANMNNISPCAGEMTVEIPEGFWVTTVDVSYDMTSTGGAFMSEQRSRLLVPAYDMSEPQYYQGVGTGGVWSYNRTGLTEFAMLTGEVTFILDAKRVFCSVPATCSTDCIYVNNNTWQLIIALEPIPECPQVIGLQVDSLGALGAMVSWTEIGDATTWDIEYGESGFTPTGVPTVTTSDNPYFISGLSGTTTYDVYVRAVCDTNEVSIWVGPLTFTTWPEFAVVVTYTDGDIPTFYDIGASTATISTCPGVLTVDIPEGFWVTTVDVSYDMTAHGGAFMSEQRSRLLAPDFGVGESSYFAGVGLGGTWQYNRTGLTMFAMLTGEIDFVLDAKRTWGTLPECGVNYNYVNNNTWTLVVAMEPIPDCPDVMNVSVDSVGPGSALISWTELGDASSWEIEYDTAGFTPTGIPSLSTSDNPYLLTGLDPDVQYDVYVRSDCDTSGVSNWIGPVSFTTACMPPDITVVGDSICEGETAYLMAFSSNPEAYINWYNQASGGDLLYQGDTFAVEGLLSTTTYYASSVIGATPVNNSLFTQNIGGNGCGGGVMFNILPNQDIAIDSFYARAQLTAGSASINVYTRVGTFQGNELNAGAWTLHSTITGPPTVANTLFTIVLPEPLELEEGILTGIYLNYASSYTNTTGLVEFSNDDLTLTVGSGLCGQFTGNNVNRAFNGEVFYRSGFGCASDRVPVTASVISGGGSIDLGGDITVCEGEEVVIEGPEGFTNYLWIAETDAGIDTFTTQNIEVTASGIYTLEIEVSPGCWATDAVLITINELPEVNITATTTAVCEGESVALIASGSDASYSWSGGIENGVAFVPEETTTYTVTATSPEGCVTEESITIVVTPYPSLTVGASSTEVCAGETVIITASGADEFVWSGGIANNQPFTPTETATYTVIGTTNGCSDTAEITITVLPSPEVSVDLDINEEICDDAAPFALTGGNPPGGEYTGAGVSGGMFDPAAAGEGVHVITYTFVHANGCSNFAVDSIIVADCTNVHDAILQNVEVYPNPFDRFVDIKWDQLPGAKAEIRLVDVLGRTLKYVDLNDQQVALGSFRLELESLPAGTFILELRSGDSVFRKTMIKSH